MNTELFMKCGLHLLGSLSALAWVWSGALARARSGGRELAWDLAWCDATVRTAAWITVTALALGAAGVLGAPAWLAATLIVGAGLRLVPVAETPPVPGIVDGPAPSTVFLVALGGFLLGRAVFGLRNPPADWDSLQYHLPMVAHWIRTHALGVAVREPQAFGTYYPGGGEVLQMWAAMSSGRETLMTWPGIVALGLMALALRRLGLLLGARTGVAEALALALVTAPGVGSLTLGTRIDNLFAAEFALALLFAVRALRSEASGDLSTALIALGLFAGTKANGPLLVTLAAVALAIAFARHGHRRGVLTPGRLALPLALGGFWLARNLLLTGNPLFPSELRLGPIHLAGLESFALLSRTTQLAVWREGYAGHLTPENLERFFGPAQLLMALGLVLAAARGLGRRAGAPLPDRRITRGLDAGAGAGPLTAIAIGGALLFLISPFSGAYWPAEHGKPPGLNWDNLRYLMPAVMAALPLAAAGLSGRLTPGTITLLGAAIVWDTRRWAGHVLPGVALAALVAVIAWGVRRARGDANLWKSLWTRHWTWLGPAGVVTAAAALALAVTVVDGQRERLSDSIWNGYLPRIHDLRAEDLRSLRKEARGRAIAVVGMDAWWGYYGRTFGGHPVYVPVGIEAQVSRRWSFTRDERAQPDSARWRRNLAASGARFVVIGAFGGDCGRVPIERRWMEADSAHFERLVGACCATASRAASPEATTGCDEAWRVREAREPAPRDKH